jgi:WD40 repeat protein
LQGEYTVAFEITAHSRFLSSFMVHPDLPWLLTAARDGTAAVWSLPADADGKVALVKSILWQNGMITGATFCGESRKSIALVSWDWDELRVWENL